MKSHLVVALAATLQLVPATADAADHREAPLIIGADTEALGVGMYLDCRRAEASDVPLEEFSLAYETIVRVQSAIYPGIVQEYPVSLTRGEFKSFDVDFADFGSGSVPLLFELSRPKLSPDTSPETVSARACALSLYARQYAKATGMTEAWPLKWKGPALGTVEDTGNPRAGLANVLEGSALESLTLGFRATCPGTATNDGYSVVPTDDGKRVHFTVSASDPHGLIAPTVQVFDLPNGGYGQFDLNFADFEVGDPRRVPIRFIIAAGDSEGSSCRLTATGRGQETATKKTTYLKYELKDVQVSSY